MTKSGSKWLTEPCAGVDWTEFSALMVAPTRAEENGSSVVAVTTAELELWTVFGVPQGAGSMLALHSSADEEQLAAFLCQAVEAGKLAAQFTNGIDTTFPETLQGLCDSMADVMWDEIDAEHPGRSDDPAEYSTLADGHPIDALRSAIGDSCGYFGADAA